MSDNEKMIGYKMDIAYGFEIFINAGGGISIRQEDWEHDEQLIVLNPIEARELLKGLNDLIDGCGPLVTEIEADPKDSE